MASISLSTTITNRNPEKTHEMMMSAHKHFVLVVVKSYPLYCVFCITDGGVQRQSQRRKQTQATTVIVLPLPARLPGKDEERKLTTQRNPHKRLA